ncbi:hypothetical protein O6H91_03G103300 [Diphasiastrum complanatum]|uniref:Uncharacterized protein n=1 Tax=Diphasiastrum complanatum TaxID=34168 RepID=A0ACC2E9R8_DIPCM|nr:hypothetical protein O6H91_03G103300 [Diphasiastrum complanatum]
MAEFSSRHFLFIVFATILVSSCRAGRQMAAFSESSFGGAGANFDTSTDFGGVAVKSASLTGPTSEVSTDFKKPLKTFDTLESHEVFDCNQESLECSRDLQIRELAAHVDYVYASVKP